MGYCKEKKTSYGFDFSKNMPQDLVKQIENISFKKAKSVIDKYFSKIYSSGFIPIYLRKVEKSWRKIEKKYFEKLEELTGKKLSAKKIIARITIAPRCPYDPQEKSFMVNFYASIPSNLATIGHEIMHLHFHEYYFNKIAKTLGEEKAHDIKEAFTVLLNVKFSDLWFISDKGYESHKNLRKFILQEWKKDKNFDKLVEKCLEKLE